MRIQADGLLAPRAGKQRVALDPFDHRPRPDVGQRMDSHRDIAHHLDEHPAETEHQQRPNWGSRVMPRITSRPPLTGISWTGPGPSGRSRAGRVARSSLAIRRADLVGVAQVELCTPPTSVLCEIFDPRRS